MVMGDTEKITHLYNYYSDSTDSMTHPRVPESWQQKGHLTHHHTELPSSPLTSPTKQCLKKFPTSMAMSQTKSGHWATQSNLRLSRSQRGFSPSNSQCGSYSTHSGKFLEGNSEEAGRIIVSSTKGDLFHSKRSLGLAIPFLLSLTLSSVLSVSSLHRRQHLLPAPFSFWFHLPKRAAHLYYHQKAKVGLATPEEPGELLVSLINESYKCQILRLGVVWRLGGSCWYC